MTKKMRKGRRFCFLLFLLQEKGKTKDCLAMSFFIFGERRKDEIRKEEFFLFFFFLRQGNGGMDTCHVFTVLLACLKMSAKERRGVLLFVCKRVIDAGFLVLVFAGITIR